VNKFSTCIFTLGVEGLESCLKHRILFDSIYLFFVYCFCIDLWLVNSSFGCIIIVSPNFIGVGIRKLVLYLNQISIYFPKIPKYCTTSCII